jgi:hypothetical protein
MIEPDRVNAQLLNNLAEEAKRGVLCTAAKTLPVLGCVTTAATPRWWRLNG